MEEVEECIDKSGPGEERRLSESYVANNTDNLIHSHLSPEACEENGISIVSPAYSNSQTATGRLLVNTDTRYRVPSTVTQLNENSLSISNLTPFSSIDPSLMGDTNDSTYSCTVPTISSQVTRTRHLLNRQSVDAESVESDPTTLSCYHHPRIDTATSQHLLKLFIDNAAPWVRGPFGLLMYFKLTYCLFV